MKSNISIRAKRCLISYLKAESPKKYQNGLYSLDIDWLKHQKGIGDVTINEILEFLNSNHLKIVGLKSPDSKPTKKINGSSLISELDNLEWGIKNALVRYLKKPGSEIQLSELEKIDFKDFRKEINLPITKLNKLINICESSNVRLSNLTKIIKNRK